MIYLLLPQQVNTLWNHTPGLVRLSKHVSVVWIMPQHMGMFLSIPTFAVAICNECDQIVRQWLLSTDICLPPSCDNCADLYQTALRQGRPCSRCVEQKTTCIKLGFLGLSMDCQSNKTCMLLFERALLEGNLIWILH